MNKKLTLELLWWIVTATLSVAIILPMVSAGNYHFLWQNIFLVAVFITITRYIFFLEHTFLSKLEWLKAVLILAAPIVIFLIVQEINRFQTFLDEYGWEKIIDSGAAATQTGLSKYIYSEMLFFGVGAAISTFILPIRMIVSIWRMRNLGKE